MSSGVQHSHDKLFRTVFADTEEAAFFLRGHLPATLAERIDWSTLMLQLLMMAAVRSQAQEAPRLAAPLMAQLTRTGGVDYVAVFVLYLAATQERKVVNEFAAQVRQYAPGTGGDMLTYAEELRLSNSAQFNSADFYSTSV